MPVTRTDYEPGELPDGGVVIDDTPPPQMPRGLTEAEEAEWIRTVLGAWAKNQERRRAEDGS